VLSLTEESIARAAAEALFPSHGPIALSGADAGCVDWFDRYLERSLPAQRRLVRMLLWFHELAALLSGPCRGRMSRLSPNDRRRYLARAARSRFYLSRVALLALRGLMTMGYFDNREVMKAIGMRHDIDPFGRDAGRLELVPVPIASGKRLRTDRRAASEMFEDAG
jgi:hypothetical protein